MLALVRRSDWYNQPIVCHFIPMLFCESDQVGVCRIAFVSDMCRKEAGVWTQHTFRAHSACVLNDLTSAQMVSTKLFGTIGMIQDHNIESHLVLLESLPRLFEQCGCIGTIKDSTADGFNRIEHRPHPRCMISGKGHHRIWAHCERLQRSDSMDIEVEILLRFRRQETVAGKISFKRYCSSFQGLSGRVK